MDLGAYINIGDLSIVAEKNGINISRLRGYRLMKNEYELIDIDEEIKNFNKYIIEDLVTSIPAWSINSNMREWNSESGRKVRRFYDFKNERIKWENIHGKRRKNLKYVLKIKKLEVKEQFNLFNKYLGREDILYIHARLGSRNWSNIHYWDYKKEPWYIDGIDDCFDNSYCDIYAKIDPNTLKYIKENTEKEDTKDNEES